MFGIRYIAPSGLSYVYRYLISTEGAIYTNDGCSSSNIELSIIISTEGAIYTNDGRSSSNIELTIIISPERGIYIDEAVTPRAIKTREIMNEAETRAELTRE